jgi:hypothetical protein
MRIISFFILSVVLLLSACNKPVYKYNKNFEGKWQTALTFDDVINLSVISEIVNDGADGTFKNACQPCSAGLCDCLNSQVGKAVMNSTRTEMKIGSSGYPLRIDEEPAIDSNGVWTMKIQGLRYYRQ